MDQYFRSKIKCLIEIRRLRNEAAHCRSLASGAVPFAVSRELEALATEYERRAAVLENAMPPTRPLAPRDSRAA
jgi:hypothetical protein